MTVGSILKVIDVKECFNIYQRLINGKYVCVYQSHSQRGDSLMENVFKIAMDCEVKRIEVVEGILCLYIGYESPKITEEDDEDEQYYW